MNVFRLGWSEITLGCFGLVSSFIGATQFPLWLRLFSVRYFPLARARAASSVFRIREQHSDTSCAGGGYRQPLRRVKADGTDRPGRRGGAGLFGV